MGGNALILRLSYNIWQGFYEPRCYKQCENGFNCLFPLRNLQMNIKTISSAIKRHRTVKGMSQAKLGSLTGFDPNTISRFETGNYPPSIEALCKISEALGVPVREFFEELETDDDKRAFLIKQIFNLSSEDLDKLIDFMSKKD